ncbi:indolepyruvate ferredoxin oxidoreductase subunit alpha [Patescibacteria group bacterium]|nr:indolepyruvate ferredoxin oxidoreductase subunit alpha [Patescibacteria group bacterium]
MEEILLNKTDKKIILLGNEAIVRGALESGVQFVSTYPGTPASEIGDTFARIANEAKIYFEYSVNEKVALEAGMGASFSGLKTLIAMKNFGLNVCLDALLPFCYTGSKGPTVIVVADDPSCHSSAQSEENTRALASLAHIPILEPSDPQECKDFVKLSFEISEKFKIPVMIRTTTRVAHQRMPIKLGSINLGKPKPEGKFVKDKKRFVTMPPRVLEMKRELLEKVAKIKKISENSKLNQVYIGQSSAKLKMGVITSGVSCLYVKEAMEELNLDLPILKLGFFHPLPEKKIEGFIKKFKKVLIVEELESYLEKEIKVLAKGVNPKLQIFGKDLLPEIGELKPDLVALALAKFAGKKYKKPSIISAQLSIPKRFPQLCQGCPYWFVFGSIKKAVNPDNVVFGGDIGCYMLAGLPPHNIQDYLVCMGSSIGIAHGIKRVSSQKLITLIGDSTFFHAGIPALINTVINKSNPLIIVMDNQITAMTGHQPNPGVLSNETAVKIEDIVKACGVKNLKIIDPINQKQMIKTIKDFLKEKEVSVIVARRPCVFVKKR